jgi:copper transport protein
VPTSTKNSRVFLVLAFASIVFAMVFSFGSRPAHAHNSQESSVPAEGSVLATAPTEWRVTFASSVPLDSASGELVLADGTRVDLGRPTHGETDVTIVFALPRDLNGAVTARWRLVGVDGHVISGRVSFAVAPPGTSSDQLLSPLTTIDTSLSEQRTPEPLRYSLRLFNYLFVIAVGGLIFVEFYVAGGTTLLLPSRRIITFGSAGLVAVPILQGLIYTADLRDTSIFAAPAGIFDALGTTPGAMYFTRAAVAAVIGFLLTKGSRNAQSEDERSAEMRRILLAAGGFMYLLTLGYVGHSRSQRLPWIGIPVDMTHTAAAAVWLGGLAVLVFIVIPTVSTEQGVRAFLRFSPAARIAVAVLVGTGVVQSIRLHDGLSSLVGSTHGRLLLLKIVLVLGMLRFAALNQRALRESARFSHGSPREQRRRLTQASVIEAALGGLVIAVTAALVSASLR